MRIDIWNAENKTFIRFDNFNMDEYVSMILFRETTYHVWVSPWLASTTTISTIAACVCALLF